MSKATKRKHVTREVLEDLVVPSGDQEVVRVGLVYMQVSFFLLPSFLSLPNCVHVLLFV